MADANEAVARATHDCVRTLRRELLGRNLAGSLDVDDFIALVERTMIRLMRRVGELTRPETGPEAFFPVILTLLFETVRLPDIPGPGRGELN